MNSIQNKPSYRSNIVLPEPVNMIVASSNSFSKLPKLAPGANPSSSLPRNSMAKRDKSASSIADEIDKIKEYDSDECESTTHFANRNLGKSLQVPASINLKSINDLTGSIPDGIRTVFTPDASKTPLPVFGRRPDSIAASYYKMQRPQDTTPQLPTPLSAAQKTEIEEIYFLLKERIRANFYDTKKKFRSADTDGKGAITKFALGHIIASMLGPLKPISHQDFLRVLDRLNLRNKNTIRFDEFLSCFQDTRSDSSEWVDPVRVNHSNLSNYVYRKATQVLVVLKEKCKQRSREMVDLVPQLVGGNLAKIYKPELFNAIAKLGIKMESEEADKLWKRLDEDNLGVISTDIFLKKLGLNGKQRDQPSKDDSNAFDASKVLNDIPLPSVQHDYYNQQQKEMQVRRSYSRTANQSPVGKWLKYRFREGFLQMKDSFEKVDQEKTNNVSREKFLEILENFGLKLEMSLLDAFLKRCEIPVDDANWIPYKTFLEKFQTRNESSVAYKMIAGNETQRIDTAIGYLEKNLLNMFQKDFLALLSKMRKIDRHKTNILTKKDFRAVIEAHFNIGFSDAEFAELCKELPFDVNQNVKYLEFMTRFDSDDTTGLFESKSANFDSPLNSQRNRTSRVKHTARYMSDLEEENDGSLERLKHANQKRTVADVRQIIKTYVRNNYKEIEAKWANIDTLNSGGMTKSMLYDLLKSPSINPEITRQEIDVIWREFILKDNKLLDYWQFIRHFGYSKESGAYKNARVAPPKRGDCDMMLTSKNLGRDNMIIRGSVQTKIQLQSESIRAAMQSFDSLRSGFIAKSDFENVLLDFCPEFNEDELEYLCKKYANQSDGRIRYDDCLAAFVMRLQRKQAEIPHSADQIVLTSIKRKLTGRHRALKRFFKQKDYKNSGYLSVGDFKDGFKFIDVQLSNEELYFINIKLDPNMTGLIDYKGFIGEYMRSDEF